jgi:O-antigen ligase
MLAIVSSLSRSGSVDHQFINKLVNSVIIIGFGIAIFGIIQKLSYNGKIYWVIWKDGSHFGPYVNYDHYAGYMGMCTLLAIAQFLEKIANSSLPHIKKFKDKIIWLSSREANKTLIYLFMAIVMTAALFSTTSRGGIMSFAAALAVFYFICVISASKKKRKRILLASFLVILLMSIMILWIGPEDTVDKFKGINEVIRFFIREKAILSEVRPYMWKDTLGLIRDFPVFGTGLGTYYCIFTKYRTFSDEYGLLRYAHNDYLHLVSEMGVVGGMFILGFFVWYMRRFRECFRLLLRNK